MGDFFVQPVSRKLTALKWLSAEAGQAYTDTNAYFITGSSEDKQELTLWKAEGQDIVEDLKIGGFQAESTYTTSHNGDVNCIDTAGPDKIVTASGFGSVSVYHVERQDISYDDDMDGTKQSKNLELVKSWKAHKYVDGSSAVCTAAKVRPTYGTDYEVVSCGEDGSIVFASLERAEAISSLQEIDSMTITDIAWVSPNQCITSMASGQVKLVDRRDPQLAKAVFIDDSNKDVSINCVAAHPSQSFRFATGNELGSALVWDIRNTKEPTTTSLKVHDQDIWQIMFHPGDTSKLITCSEDASIVVVDWDTSEAKKAQSNTSGGLYAKPFAISNQSQDKQDRVSTLRRMKNIFNTLSVNCFDYYKHGQAGILAAGTDSENILFEPLESATFSLF
ncbi:hypothetical protein H4219_000574 [Mycoemilia scoparia]|uniref:Uncharacterized protein n=1 Tax=Mycoemilia scoparia TaxID=417184 RepID=A0A9W8A5J3_9FUNG|nr:hypothetical protein H4219_000574 [Mycoemilia scoparia]